MTRRARSGVHEGDPVEAGQLAFYGPLAELYLRLNHVNQAEQVLTQGLSFAKEGDKALFALHSLLGDIYDRKRELRRRSPSTSRRRRRAASATRPVSRSRSSISAPLTRA